MADKAGGFNKPNSNWLWQPPIQKNEETLKQQILKGKLRPKENKEEEKELKLPNLNKDKMKEEETMEFGSSVL